MAKGRFATGGRRAESILQMRANRASGAATTGGSTPTASPGDDDASKKGIINTYERLSNAFDPWAREGRNEYGAFAPRIKEMFPFVNREPGMRPPTPFEAQNPQFYDPYGTPLNFKNVGEDYNTVGGKAMADWTAEDYWNAYYIPDPSNPLYNKVVEGYNTGLADANVQPYQVPKDFNPLTSKFAGLPTTGWIFGTPGFKDAIQVTGKPGETGWYVDPNFQKGEMGMDLNVNYGPGGVPEPADQQPKALTMPVANTGKKELPPPPGGTPPKAKPVLTMDQILKQQNAAIAKAQKAGTLTKAPGAR